MGTSPVVTEYGFKTATGNPHSAARCGNISTPHGSFETPAFMPVGTQASIKGLSPWQVAATGAGIVLSNTYHLHLRPGEELIREMGGLHKFMGWDGPILTDSGGYQVFSLAHRRVIEDGGVRFRSHIDGAECFLGPREAMEIQIALGSDIIMSFDECMPHPVERSYAEESLQRTLRWEEETISHHPRDGRALFGIVQGGVHEDLRVQSTRALLDLPFDGYAIGGLFVGEDRDETMQMLDVVGSLIPDDYARYVMGVGSPVEVLDCIARGWDMFDCVLPTRNGRHGHAMTRGGIIRLKNARHRNDPGPIEEGCPCPACWNLSRSYLRHLFVAGESLGGILVSQHNLVFMQELMNEARKAIAENRFDALRDEMAAAWQETPEDADA